jgi:hypothetical protein
MIGDLLELAWVSLAATIVLSVAASACVLGVTRVGELRRAGEGGAAMRHAALAAIGAAVAVAGVVGALVVIVSG